jgi:choline dehydrogenase-like flavoprotein
MHIDGRDITEGSVLRAQVCVVGAGPAGLTLADSLSLAGHDVLLVEAGERRPPAGGDLYSSTTSVGAPYPLLTSRSGGVGGSAHRWGFDDVMDEPSLRLHELDEIDLCAVPGVHDLGWPFARSALDAVYARARELFEVPPLDPSREHAVDGPVERRVYAYGRARTFIEDVPRRLSARRQVTMVTDLVVVDVRTDEDPAQVSSLRCRTTAGASCSVEAELYVLAAGGIENARLLLASRSTHEQGLGNGSDHVGRWFNEHPHHGSALVLPQDGRIAGDPGKWAFVHEGGATTHAMYGLSGDCLRSQGLLNTAFMFTPRPARMAVSFTPDGQVDVPAMAAFRRLKAVATSRRWDWGAPRDLLTTFVRSPGIARTIAQQRAAQAATAAGRPPRVPVMLTLVSMNEQQPRADSRVRLTAGTDRFGVPEAELDWRVTTFDHESMKRTLSLVAPSLGRLFGATLLSLLTVGDLPPVTQGYHHLSTTRMADAPRDGVVDRDGRVHGVRNLFVTGSSVFTSGGAANPTLTIVALAVRLGLHLHAKLAAPVIVAGHSGPAAVEVDAVDG